jgi:enoyl-CoA hydratase/carnithine racemase
MSTLELVCVHDGPITHLTLNRPDKRNALSSGLVEQLHQELDSAFAAGQRAIILQGEGRNFSAGFDFGQLETASEAELRWRFIRIQQLLAKIASSPALTVGLAHGRNFGAGVDLLAACQWRIGAPGSTFRMPGLKFDLALGSARFAALVGASNALRILEQSATFDAAQAHDMGFLTQLAALPEWGAIKQGAMETAQALSVRARMLLHSAVVAHDHNKDMALLVESLSEPGLKDRINAYLTA